MRVQGQTRVAYLTDVEGRWDKVQSFATDNPDVTLQGEALHLTDGVRFVFGGDAVDRGPQNRKVLRALLAAKQRYGDRVVLLAGNRDINKLRLLRELDGQPPWHTPDDLKASRGPELLRWIFKWTMGAGEAFALRAKELELEGLEPSDKRVHDSLLEDIADGGLLNTFLKQSVLAHREGNTLYVHGAVSNESLGRVPKDHKHYDDVDAWIRALNLWFTEQMSARDHGGEKPPWLEALRYQAPRGMTKHNPASVVYGRLSDELGNPQLPEAGVMRLLQEQGVRRLVVGHTPCGDSPAYVSDGSFEAVLADNSYARLESGSQVSIDADRVRVKGRVELDDGSVHALGFEASRLAAAPIGLRDEQEALYPKGILGDGRVVMAKLSPGYRLEQKALTPTEVSKRHFTVPTRRTAEQ